MKLIHRRQAGVTLTELLVVMAIIGILAGFSLGPVLRARAYAQDKVWRMEAYDLYRYIEGHLSAHYQAQKNYPVLSAAELHQQGVFDDRIMDFLRCPSVQFIPFSMNDSDEKIILRVNNYWLDKQKPVPGHTNDLVMLKKQVTKPENSK